MTGRDARSGQPFSAAGPPPTTGVSARSPHPHDEPLRAPPTPAHGSCTVPALRTRASPSPRSRFVPATRTVTRTRAGALTVTRAADPALERRSAGAAGRGPSAPGSASARPARRRPAPGSSRRSSTAPTPPAASPRARRSSPTRATWMPSLSAHATDDPSGRERRRGGVVRVGRLQLRARSGTSSPANTRRATRVGVPPDSAASSSSTATRVPSREAAASKPVAHGEASSLNQPTAVLSPPRS